MVWSFRSVKTLGTTPTRRTRALKQSRIVDVFAAARRGRRPRPKRPSSPKKVKVITKVSKIKMVLRGLNAGDLMADEPPLPPTPVEKTVVTPSPKVVEFIEVVATAVSEPESGLVFSPFTCNETMCSCWGNLAIPVGNVCTLCSATKYSGFEKLDMHGGVPLPKVDAKQQRPVKARQAAKRPVKALPKPKPVKLSSKATKPLPKPKPAKPPPKPTAIKKLKLPKPLPRPTTPTTPAERPRKLTSVVDPMPLDWDCQPDLDALFPVGFFTPDDVDNLFADF
jgi:hypothetical protein